MNFIMKVKKSILIVCMTLVCILIGCNRLPVAGEIEYKEIEKNTTKDDLQKKLGARPNKTETQDNLESYIYEKSKYLSYNGSMTYYLVEDKVLYSRWETKAEDKKHGQEIYKNICESLAKDCSKLNETEEGLSIVSVWNSKEGTQKTVTFLEGEEEIIVSIMTIE